MWEDCDKNASTAKAMGCFLEAFFHHTHPKKFSLLLGIKEDFDPVPNAH